MIKKKKHLYICNGAAYSFYDYQLDLIKSLLRKGFKVTLIQYDYFISDLFLNYVKVFDKDQNFNFYIIKQLLTFSAHKSFVKIIRNFRFNKPDLIIITSETTVFSRYLISYANKNNIKIGLLQQNFLDMGLLKQKTFSNNYHIKINNEKSKQKNKEILFFKIKNKYKNFKNKFTKLFFLIMKLINSKIKKFISISLNFYVYPFILTRMFFIRNSLDKYTFFAGRVDFVMCQKKGDIDILKEFAGQGLKYYLISNKKKIIQDNKKSKSALFILGSIYEELDEESLSYLNRIGYFLKQNKIIEEIDLRLHPRTDPDLNWPNILKYRLEKLSIKVNIMRAEKEPLINICGSYGGIVSSLTSSLKICEQNSDKFIVCVLNVSGKRKFFKEESWMLGSDPGINIINCGEKLSKSIFMRKKDNNESIEVDLLVANILRGMVS